MEEFLIIIIGVVATAIFCFSMGYILGRYLN